MFSSRFNGFTTCSGVLCLIAYGCAWAELCLSAERAPPIRALDRWQIHWQGILSRDLTPPQDVLWQDYLLSNSPLNRLGGARHVWFRAPLLAIESPRPALFIEHAWQEIVVWVDGQEVYRFGDIGRQETASARVSFKSHLIELPPGDAGRILTILVRSDERAIGIYGRVVVGSEQAISAAEVVADLPKLMMSCVNIFLGMTLLTLATTRLPMRLSLTVGTFALAMGLYQLSRTFVAGYLPIDPYTWDVVEVISVQMLAMMTLTISELMFGRGPGGIFRGSRKLSVVVLAGSIIFTFGAEGSVWSTLAVWQVLALIISPIFILLTLLKARSGNVDARLLLTGIIINSLGFLNDLLVILGIVPWTLQVDYLTSFILVLTMIAILSRQVVLRQVADAVLAREAELSARARLRTVSHLAGGVAHEINNPLTVVEGALEIVYDGLVQQPFDHRLMQTVEAARRMTKRIHSITSSLLLISREAPASSTERCALGDVLADIKAVRIEADPDLWLAINARDLSEILRILILNAHDAVAGTAAPEIYLRAMRNDGWVRVTVVDNGIGVADIDRERIFDPFFSAKEFGKGTGLGLTIARCLAERAGGSLSLTARCNPTEFVLVVAVAPALKSAA